MKRIVILVFIIVFSLVGCSDTSAATEKPPVEINMPKDQTVNGYRTSSISEPIDSSTINANEVELEQSSNHTTSSQQNTIKPQKIQYCANANSMVFHKPDCGSVKQMKEENKIYSSSREELLKDGFTPCKSCKP